MQMVQQSPAVAASSKPTSAALSHRKPLVTLHDGPARTTRTGRQALHVGTHNHHQAAWTRLAALTWRRRRRAGWRRRRCQPRHCRAIRQRGQWLQRRAGTSPGWGSLMLGCWRRRSPSRACRALTIAGSCPRARRRVVRAGSQQDVANATALNGRVAHALQVGDAQVAALGRRGRAVGVVGVFRIPKGIGERRTARACRLAVSVTQARVTLMQQDAAADDKPLAHKHTTGHQTRGRSTWQRRGGGRGAGRRAGGVRAGRGGSGGGRRRRGRWRRRRRRPLHCRGRGTRLGEQVRGKGGPMATAAELGADASVRHCLPKPTPA